MGFLAGVIVYEWVAGGMRNRVRQEMRDLDLEYQVLCETKAKEL